MTIPANPTEPFDATHLSDKEVLMLTDTQRYHAVLTERQMKMESNARAPLEARPERIPAPADMDKIRSLFKWADFLHDRVRSPAGMAWVEMQIMLCQPSADPRLVRVFPTDRSEVSLPHRHPNEHSRRGSRQHSRGVGMTYQGKHAVNLVHYRWCPSCYRAEQSNEDWGDA